MNHQSLSIRRACRNNLYDLCMQPLVRPQLRLQKHHMALLALTLLLLCGSVLVSPGSPDALAANPGPGKGCHWYRVSRGDTLSQIARRYGSSVAILGRVNTIENVNLIYINQNICIPYNLKQATGRNSGLLPNGTVRWYAYNALEYSNHTRVEVLLRRAAARYRLPENLLLAIAWQESGWNHHIIAKDGGIGLMQIMPYTAQGLNTQVHGRYDPYKLYDNIELAAIYLRSLWRGFHGDITKVISAYNQGGWSVRTRGIFNWRYVNSVCALMKRY